MATNHYRSPESLRICDECGNRSSRHRILPSRDNSEIHLCCKCFVGRGFPPADWHLECMMAVTSPTSVKDSTKSS